jgi:hypothetical protein
MRTTTTEVRPAKFETTQKFCDLCKQPISVNRMSASSEANVAIRPRRPALLDCTERNNYGDSGDSSGLELDCCAQCFDDKIVPLIESTFGVKFAKTECSW